MAKRFIDTDLFRKPFMRGLEAPYKALWIYLLCECDHAGVWVVELDVAQIRMGLKLDPDKVIEKMAGAVVPVGDGSKWFLPDFVTFQYGTLNPSNRVHASVIDRLTSLGIDPENKPLESPLEGAKDKDKDKDKDIQGGKERAIAERIEAFAAEVERINAERGTLQPSELVKFIAHWTQAGPNDRKFHAEKQQTFGIAGRLVGWAGNVKTYPAKGGAPPAPMDRNAPIETDMVTRRA
jgi:hypothetical protein